MMIFWFFNLFNIVYTGVHRFNTRGNLCAMSENPTEYEDVEAKIVNDSIWTYVSDG